jgi:hypothetical protein
MQIEWHNIKGDPPPTTFDNRATCKQRLIVRAVDIPYRDNPQQAIILGAQYAPPNEPGGGFRLIADKTIRKTTRLTHWAIIEMPEEAT